MKQQYVIGFMFDNHDMENVLLIYKLHGPKCILNRWNGIGGHVELNEEPVDAMVREFQEEAGVHTLPLQWNKFCEMMGDDFIVYCYWTINVTGFHQAKTMTDEPIKAITVNELPNRPISLAPNLAWFILFLRDKTCKHDLGQIQMNYGKNDAIAPIQTGD